MELIYLHGNYKKDSLILLLKRVPNFILKKYQVCHHPVIIIVLKTKNVLFIFGKRKPHLNISIWPTWFLVMIKRDQPRINLFLKKHGFELFISTYRSMINACNFFWSSLTCFIQSNYWNLLSSNFFMSIFADFWQIFTPLELLCATLVNILLFLYFFLHWVQLLFNK